MSREKDTLGSFMRAMRLQNHCTQRSLAERLGRHERLISSIENGHSKLTMADIVCLAHTFNVKPIEVYKAMDESLTRGQSSAPEPKHPRRPRSAGGP